MTLNHGSVYCHMKISISISSAVTFLFYLSIVCYVLRVLIGVSSLVYLGTFLGVLVFLGQTILGARLPVLLVFALLISCASYIFSFANNGFAYGALFVPHLISAIGIAWRIHRKGINYSFCMAVFYGSVAY